MGQPLATPTMVVGVARAWPTRLEILCLIAVVVVYRIAGYFRGVPIFVIFVTHLPPTKFSTHNRAVQHVAGWRRLSTLYVRLFVAVPA